MRVGITGSSGLIGTALAQRLTTAGHEVVRFVRRPAAAGEVHWNPASGQLDAGDVESLEAVVHLAGVGIADHRWTDAHKRAIVDSRVQSTSLLAGTIARAGAPRVLLSGSAIGYYGDGDERVDETSPPGDDFLATACVDWEAATGPAEAAGARVVHLRTGIVLSRDGGALRKMLPLFRLGVGGRFGKGTQWMSWITVDDEVAAIEHLLTSSVAGAVNLTAPTPVRNAEFAKTLARTLHRPALVPVPKFGPQLLLGKELADSLLFTGQRVEPAVLIADGFRFQHPDLATALSAVLD